MYTISQRKNRRVSYQIYLGLFMTRKLDTHFSPRHMHHSPKQTTYWPIKHISIKQSVQILFLLSSLAIKEEMKWFWKQLRMRGHELSESVKYSRKLYFFQEENSFASTHLKGEKAYLNNLMAFLMKLKMINKMNQKLEDGRK